MEVLYIQSSYSDCFIFSRFIFPETSGRSIFSKELWTSQRIFGVVVLVVHDREVGPGEHEYTYFARATTPGLFIVPPAKAEEMYEPETFGRGSSDRVRVE